MADDRKRKEAEALRANLLKRKAQQRARADKGQANERSGPAQNDDGHNQSAPESIAGGERRG